MLAKLKENLALIVTAITLMGSIGAGVQSLTAVIDTLTGIDDRMNIIETDFQVLKDSTMAYNAEYLETELTTLRANYQNLEVEVRDLEWKLEDFQARYISELNNPPQDSQAYELMKWEWQDLLKKVTVLETNQLESWQLDDLKNRIAYVEAMMHGH